MRLLAIAFCLIVSGCIGPHAGYNSSALPSVYSQANGGVNVGHNPRVTEMHNIKGELYIY